MFFAFLRKIKKAKKGVIMKIQSITLALLSAIALSACSSISTEIGTDEMADNSFPVESEVAEEGNLLYYTPSEKSCLFPKKRPEYSGNDILIEGKHTSTRSMGITKDYLSDILMFNARVYSQVCDGRISSEGSSAPFRFDTHVGWFSSYSKEFLLKSSECSLGTLNFIDKYSTQTIQTPYKAATVMPNGGGTFEIYATKQLWYIIKRGKNATDEQFAKVNKQPGMDMKLAFREKRQVFQVTDESGTVLADFTMNSYRIFQNGMEKRESVRSSISLFCAWVWVCDEILEKIEKEGDL